MKKSIFLLLILVLALVAGCASKTSLNSLENTPKTEIIQEMPKTQETENSKEPKTALKALFVIAPTNFKDEEYFTPKKILEENGVKTVTASLSKEATSVNNKKAAVDVLLEDVSKDFDAVVFIGGPGADIYFNNKKAHEIAVNAFNNKKVVAAICIAPSTLANAGILNGKKATAFYTEKNNLESKGAIYTGKDITVDGDIITANGPEAASLFAKTILDKLI